MSKTFVLFRLSLLVLAQLSVCSGCAFLASTEDTTAPITNPPEISLFAARKSLGKNEFERYRLKNGVFFEECGELDSSSTQHSESSPVPDLILGRYTMRRSATQLTTLPYPAAQPVFVAALELVPQLAESAELEEKPNLASVGLFEVVLSREHGGEPLYFLTSFDSVADQTSTVSRMVYELYVKMRSIPNSKCGSRPFFGVGNG